MTTFADLPVLWDLDGTLVDSAADIAAAVDRALVGNALPALGERAVRRHIGSGAQHLLTACTEEAGGEMSAKILADFFVAYRAHIADQTVLYPGMRALLREIQRPQAVVTNKPIAMTEALLESLGIRAQFAAVYGGESLPMRKPHPMMLHAAMAEMGVTRAVMVGDGPHDVSAARAAGIPMIGVDWGIAKPEGADVRVPSVAALARLLI